MHTLPLALIVDDEPDIRELLHITLQRMNIEVRAAADLAEARSLLGHHSFDLCLTDMRLPDGNGIDLVEYIQKNYTRLPVAVITAHGNMESAITALKAGAFDFVSKPVDLQVLRNLVATALKVSREVLPTVLPQEDVHNSPLLGKSAVMDAVRTRIAKVARSQAPIHICGESGSGKELVARLIHQQSPRSDRAFVPINCGAIPEHLMESEFFGHKKGSFTGAVGDKEGLFQIAHQGTLFLDEVADLPLHMQVKLLRVIQEKAVRPIGAVRELPVDVRIVSATHKDLSQLVKQGEFRQDLFYRINVIEVRVPSLRERKEDIPFLAAHILQHINQDTPARLTPEAINVLTAYAFPGNVRELENILERAVTLCEDGLIRAEDLHLPEIETLDGEEEKSILALNPYLDTLEKDRILSALEQTKYNKTAAAKKLGITFRALRYRLKKLGLDD